MHKGKILILDSGLGGLPYAKEILTTLPPLNRSITIDYLADNQGFPYGTKSPAKLTAHLTQLAQTIAKVQPAYDFIVIACNTASIYGQVAFEQLFSPHQIILTTPTLYLSQQPQTQNLLLLASGATCKAYAHSPHIQVIPADDLISWIEHQQHHLTPAQQERYLHEYYHRNIKPLDGDTLLLGCTHFLHIRENFLSISNQKLIIADTRKIVAKALYQAIVQHERHLEVGKVVSRYFYLTLQNKKDNLYYKDIAGDYNFELNKDGLS